MLLRVLSRRHALSVTVALGRCEACLQTCLCSWGCGDGWAKRRCAKNSASRAYERHCDCLRSGHSRSTEVEKLMSVVLVRGGSAEARSFTLQLQGAMITLTSPTSLCSDAKNLGPIKGPTVDRIHFNVMSFMCGVTEGTRKISSSSRVEIMVIAS